MVDKNDMEKTKSEGVLKRLEVLMVEHDIQPEEVINLLRPGQIHISKRTALRAGLATVVGVAAFSSISNAGDVSSGQIATQITQTASLRGTDDSEIADLSSNFLDLSPKEHFVLPSAGSSAPVGAVSGSLWWDSTV